MATSIFELGGSIPSATGFMFSVQQVATPAFSPVAGTYTSTQSVTVTCSTPSSTIHYTTNGSTPTTGSAVYSTPISVAATETINAIAVAVGYTQSIQGSAAYTIESNAATPTFSPVAGSYSSAQTVTISCSTGSSTIYYTVDGSTPTYPITGTTQTYSGTINVGATETLKAIGVASGYTNSAVGTAAYTITSGATLIFNYPNFSGATGLSYVSNAAISGNDVNLTTGTGHQGGALWYSTAQNIQAFTTTFSFVVPGEDNYGFVFAIQNSNDTTNPFGYGNNGGDVSSNGIGYGAGGGSGQPATGNSIGLVFSTTPFNQASWYVSPPPNVSVTLCVDGGPSIGAGSTNAQGFAATIDTHPFGINFGSGNPIQSVVTYDGTTLTLVAVDTVALTTTRLSWPINIPAIVGANTAYVGFTSNHPGPTGLVNYLASWNYYTGIYTRLATPTFGVTAGQYTGTQTVSLSGPGGSTIYYTTNGMPPTTSSTQYTGTAITVSTSQVITAVAIQTGYTDSLVGQALYLIQSGATPTVNFPSGFASANGLIQYEGYAQLSSGNILLTDTTETFESAAAWFAVAKSISTFSTTFTVNLSSVNTGYVNGWCFVVQGYPQTTTGTNYNWTLGNGPYGITVVSGGPYTLGSPANGADVCCLGYTQIFNSIGVAFDLSTNSVGLYTNGAPPTGSQITITNGVSLTSTTAISVTIAYNGTALTLTMVQGADTFGPYTLSSSINIPTLVGSSNGFVGFTGANGYGSSNIQISTWTM